MVFENIIISDAGVQDAIRLGLTILFGVFLALLTGFIIRKFADTMIYPSIRKSSPKHYKKTVNTVNFSTTLIQWAIILVFIFQALSIFNISIFEEIVVASISFLPRLVVALLIILIGFVINNIISRSILNSKFRSRDILSKLFGFLFMFAVILSALEVIDIKLTPFMDMFRVLLYTVGLTVAIAIGVSLGSIFRPEISEMLNEFRSEKDLDQKE